MPWRDQLLPERMVRVCVVAPSEHLRPVLVQVADAGVFEPDPPDVAAGAPAEDECSMDQRVATAEAVGRCSVVPGWIPSPAIATLRSRVAPGGGAVVEIPTRRGLVAPTAHVESRIGGALRPLVTTYATVPYRDLDPTLFAAAAYMVMFGMMFGDVAHGLAITSPSRRRSCRCWRRRVRPRSWPR